MKNVSVSLSLWLLLHSHRNDNIPHDFDNRIPIFRRPVSHNVVVVPNVKLKNSFFGISIHYDDLLRVPY